jgi:hypothetical protein
MRTLSHDRRLAGIRQGFANEVGRPRWRMNQTRRKNIVENTLDVRVQPQYDYMTCKANQATVATTLFAIGQGGQYTPPGGTALTKTAWHTSMITGNQQLDNPKKLLVLNIAIQLDPAMAPPDVNAALINYLATFNMFQKIFWQGHAMQLPAGAGPFVNGSFVTGTTAASGSSALYTSASNGYPTQQNYNTLVYAGGGVAGPSAGTDQNGNPLPAPQLPPITGVLIEQGAPFNVVMDPTQTNTPGTGFTTSNLTAAANGILSVGVSLWVYLCGVTFVAVV